VQPDSQHDLEATQARGSADFESTIHHSDGSAPAAARASVAAPERAGRYLLIEEIGSGAMGTVHAAYDPQLDRKIALKLLRPERGADREFCARMLREAQALAKLSHPNVVAVYDAGTFGDQVFIAMDFIRGATLRQWLAVRRPWRERLEMFLQAGRGLAAAHAVGLIHREHKPRPHNPAPNTGAPPISSDPAELRGRGLPPIAPRCLASTRSYGKTVAMATGLAHSVLPDGASSQGSSTLAAERAAPDLGPPS
jgi:hypothetical protein